MIEQAIAALEKERKAAEQRVLEIKRAIAALSRVAVNGRPATLVGSRRRLSVAGRKRSPAEALGPR